MAQSLVNHLKECGFHSEGKGPTLQDFSGCHLLFWKFQGRKGLKRENWQLGLVGAMREMLCVVI